MGVNECGSRHHLKIARISTEGNHSFRQRQPGKPWHAEQGVSDHEVFLKLSFSQSHDLASKLDSVGKVFGLFLLALGNLGICSLLHKNSYFVPGIEQHRLAQARGLSWTAAHRKELREAGIISPEKTFVLLPTLIRHVSVCRG